MDEKALQWVFDNKVVLGATATAYCSGFFTAMVIPPADMAVWAFRLALKFPPVLWAVKKNPAAFKAMFDAAEQALDKVVDEVAPANPKPVEPPKP